MRCEPFYSNCIGFFWVLLLLCVIYSRQLEKVTDWDKTTLAHRSNGLNNEIWEMRSDTKLRLYRNFWRILDIDSLKMSRTLCVACKSGDLEGAKQMILNGEDINITNDLGYTLLYAASSRGRSEIVKVHYWIKLIKMVRHLCILLVIMVAWR